MRREDGFTLIELLMAMTVFSFMLLMIISGFLDIVHIHSQAISANIVQDNAQTIMSTLDREIRDGGTVTLPVNGTTNSQLCLNGGTVLFYLNGSGALMQAAAVNCAGPTGATQLSSPDVKIYAMSYNGVAGGVHPTINLSLTIGTLVGTTGSGAGTTCNITASTRTACYVSTVVSAASPRGDAQ